MCFQETSFESIHKQGRRWSKLCDNWSTRHLFLNTTIKLKVVIFNTNSAILARSVVDIIFSLLLSKASLSNLKPASCDIAIDCIANHLTCFYMIGRYIINFSILRGAWLSQPPKSIWKVYEIFQSTLSTLQFDKVLGIYLMR